MGPHPLLAIFHDPPSIMNMADPITGNVELHNTWLVSFTVLCCMPADFGRKD
jgi:histone deacetylase 6